jgi:hypothetical protein
LVTLAKLDQHLLWVTAFAFVVFVAASAAVAVVAMDVQ